MKPTENDEWNERANNLLAAGGAHMALALGGALDPQPVVDANGDVTNQIDVGFGFLKSRYRLTIERVPDPDEEPERRPLAAGRRGET